LDPGERIREVWCRKKVTKFFWKITILHSFLLSFLIRDDRRFAVSKRKGDGQDISEKD
jgi:hypothetical protein